MDTMMTTYGMVVNGHDDYAMDILVTMMVITTTPTTYAMDILVTIGVTFASRKG